MTLLAKKLRIQGRVQGVGYRKWFEQKAKVMGVTGWVRNRLDGSVEALVVGPQDILDQLISLTYTGPEAANVSSVDVAEAMGLTPRDRFDIKPTV